MTSKIELKGLKFFAHHGLYAEEREKGSWFKVDISFFCDAEDAIKNDEITGTINYEEIYRIVQDEMQVPSKLIEHVGQRIVNRLKSEINAIEHIRLKLTKICPPINGDVQNVAIIIEED